jgi:hypothetical protein
MPLLHYRTEIVHTGEDHWVTLTLNRHFCNPPLEAKLYVDGDEVAEIPMFLAAYVKVDSGPHHFRIVTRENQTWETPENGIDVRGDTQLRVTML